MHDKTILVTGSGSFAKAFAQHVLDTSQPKKIILLSRDEWLLTECEQRMKDPRKKMRYFIGDVRDMDRLWLAIQGVDYVVHSAAMKRVDKIEYNPLEAVKTNVDGTANLVRACVEHKVERAVFLSTDKAVEPINLYGATKAVAEKVWLHANYYKPIFSVCRYGNVMGSRGSVLPYWQSLLAAGAKELPVTDFRMTRFWTDMTDAVDLVEQALAGPAGYIWIPKIPAFDLTDLAKALYVRVKLTEVGMRPGEKLHETLINEYEALRTASYQKHWLIVPELEYIEREEPKPGLSAPVCSKDAEKINQLQIRDKLAAMA